MDMIRYIPYAVSIMVQPLRYNSIKIMAEHIGLRMREYCIHKIDIGIIQDNTLIAYFIRYILKVSNINRWNYFSIREHEPLISGS